MAEWIKFAVGQVVTLKPTSVDVNMYNGEPSGMAYTCNNGVMFRATDQLHEMIKTYSPNQGIGQSLEICKIMKTNAKGKSFPVFTLDGKTLEEHQQGGGVATPPPVATTPVQNGGTPQPPTTTLEQELFGGQVSAPTNPPTGTLESLQAEISQLKGALQQLANTVEVMNKF